MVTATQRISKTKIIESLLRIDNKQGLVVPLSPNRMQKYYLENKTNRNIILKHRQGGLSTIALADMFTDCIIIPNTSCAVVSHETRATQRLLDRVAFFYDNMDDPRPTLGADSRSELSFPKLHSSIYIGTAGARAFGRGDTIRKALLSELAFYEDGAKILNGVEDAVPITGELTIECSPNGEDNVFYEQWSRARESKSPYKPFFFPWWWSDDYAIPLDSELALPEDRGKLTYSNEEQTLVEKNHLTESQIRWRRWKIAEKQGLFFQEYPEDEVSCFITIGDPVFDQEILNAKAQACYEGEKHPKGWTFWKAPEAGRLYVVAADSSAGAPGGSYSAAAVLSDRWEVVATYQARIEPHMLAALLVDLGNWYNHAEIAVERNFTGYAVLGHMQTYGNVYYQRDFTTGKITSNKGWWTNDQTRQYMMTAAKDHLSACQIWDMNLVRQLRSFRYIKYRATAQTFDDLAMAFMIGVAVRKVMGVARGFQGTVPGWSW
jgi:hypothetical protein